MKLGWMTLISEFLTKKIEVSYYGNQRDFYSKRFRWELLYYISFIEFWKVIVFVVFLSDKFFLILLSKDYFPQSKPILTEIIRSSDISFKTRLTGPSRFLFFLDFWIVRQISLYFIVLFLYSGIYQFL